MRVQYLSYIFIVSLLSFSAKGQQLNLFLNHDYSAFTDKAFNRTDVSIHTGFKPLIQSQVNQYEPCDSVEGYIFTGPKKPWLYRKFYQESLINIKDSVHRFWATIDPLFNFQLGIDNSDSSNKYYINTRGFLIQGGIGDKFSFGTTFLENQANYPYYIYQFVYATNVVPGQGRVKFLNARNGGSFYSQGFDFSSSTGYFTYTPCKHFLMQFGEGKNFVGDGYRSLLLSDNSFNYPYAKFITTFGRFQYTNLYTLFMNPFNRVISQGTEGLIQRKAGSFQYLSWNIIPRIELGVFQGLIWQASDSNNRQRYNFNYFNPLIGVNALSYGLHNTNNVLLGSTLKVKVCNYFMVYGQLVVDDIGQDIHNKMGFQGGFKAYINNAELQFEYNHANAYTYATDDPAQSYSNYNQALADPLGANFNELVTIVNYHFLKHFAVHAEIDYATCPNTYGSNIFATDNQPETMPPGYPTSSLIYFDGYVSYLLNPKTHMNISLGITHRSTTLDSQAVLPSSNLIYFGFRTSIDNFYRDF